MCERRRREGSREYAYCGSTQTPVSSALGFLKGKSTIAIARLCGKERNFSGEHFGARGYAISPVGFELEQVRQYIREQKRQMLTADSSEPFNKGTRFSATPGLMARPPLSRTNSSSHPLGGQWLTGPLRLRCTTMNRLPCSTEHGTAGIRHRPLPVSHHG
jgi:putative transposase